MKDIGRADQYLSYCTILKEHKVQQEGCALFDSFLVYNLQNPGSRLKYKSFLHEVADYWAGMTLQLAQDENDVEAADDDPSPPTSHRPRRGSVGRMPGDMKEHQLEAIVSVEKKKYPPKNPAKCVRLTKNVETLGIRGVFKKYRALFSPA